MTKKILKYLLGTAFALVVFAYAPEALAASISISGNVTGYGWTISGPVGGSATGDYYAPGVPDGTYSLTAVTPPSGYYLSSVNGSVNLAAEASKTGGVISWALSFAALNGSTYVGSTGNPTMTVGSTQAVTVTFTNTSGATWTTATQFKLGIVNPPSIDWGTGGRVALPGNVAPGSNAVFSFNITAPATPGTYDFQAQVLQEGFYWIGNPSPVAQINVTAPPPATPSFSFSPASIPWNTNTNVSWDSPTATACTSPDFPGSLPPSVTNQAVGPFTASKTYSLTCSNASGSSPTAYAPLTVTGGPPPPSGTLEVRQDNTGTWTGANGTYPYGSTIEFRWTDNGTANSCYVSPMQALGGQWTVRQNAEYATGDGEEIGPLSPGGLVTKVDLVCSNAGATDLEVDTITITVGPGPAQSVVLEVNGSGGPVYLPWGSSFTGSITMTNLTSCDVTVNGGSPTTFTSSTSGTFGPFTQSLIFAASCIGPNGSSSDSVSVIMTGSITITSNIPGLNWTLTGPQTFNGSAYPTGQIPDAPFGSYMLVPPAQTGYDVFVTPCNPQVLDDTAATCP